MLSGLIGMKDKLKPQINLLALGGNGLKRKHVFVSYVSEDADLVHALKQLIEIDGVSVWLDRNELTPGVRWKEQIRSAIKTGAFFLACFSPNYLKRQKSYMNEELNLAIEELRMRPYNTSWFIPIRLLDTDIPDWPIGGGLTLRDLQRVDLFPNPIDGLNKLKQTLMPAITPYRLFKKQLPSFINSKIQHFSTVGVLRINDVEKRWLGLLKDSLVTNLCASHIELWERARRSGLTQVDRIIEPTDSGRVITLSVSPFDDTSRLAKELSQSEDAGKSYKAFIIDQKKQCRSLTNWEKRDYIHIAHLIGEKEVLLDMFYIPSTILQFKIMGWLSEQQPREEDDLIQYSPEFIYPTSIINSLVANDILGTILTIEAELLQKKMESYANGVQN